MNMTAVQNVQNKKRSIRRAILSYVNDQRTTSINDLIEMSEREVRFKSLGARRYSLKSYIPTATSRLVDNGFLEWRKTRNDKPYLSLTEKGHARLLGDTLAPNNLRQSNRAWDNKWRVIIFDVKETKRFWRSRLRDELRKLGFVMIQQSVWVTPHPCEDLVALLRTSLHVGKEVIYLNTDRFDGDIWLRKHFRLV